MAPKIKERGHILRGKLCSTGRVNKFCGDGDQYKFWPYIFLWFMINEDGSIFYAILI